MFFKKKKVLCTKCGFFCWAEWYFTTEVPNCFEEISCHDREKIQFGGQGGWEGYEKGGSSKILCVRKQWGWPEAILTKDVAKLEKIRESRKCLYYIDYEPGFGPEEHKELKREADTRRTVFWSGIIGAMIGAAASTIGYLIYGFLFSH